MLPRFDAPILSNPGASGECPTGRYGRLRLLAHEAQTRRLIGRAECRDLVDVEPPFSYGSEVSVDIVMVQPN